MKKKNTTPKTRSHRDLFVHDTPYGHKVEKDRTKIIPRKQKYKEA